MLLLVSGGVPVRLPLLKALHLLRNPQPPFGSQAGFPFLKIEGIAMMRKAEGP
jgi:hypothetical protein